MLLISWLVVGGLQGSGGELRFIGPWLVVYRYT